MQPSGALCSAAQDHEGRHRPHYGRARLDPAPELISAGSRGPPSLGVSVGFRI